MAATGVPLSAILFANGWLDITWGSFSSSIGSIPNWRSQSPGELNLQYGFAAAPGICPTAVNAQHRGKLVGATGDSDTRHNVAANNRTRSECSVVVSQTSVGQTGTNLVLSTPRLQTSVNLGYCTAGSDWNAQNNTTGWTIPFQNFYTGPTSDIRLNFVAASSTSTNARPLVNTDTGIGSTTTINFEWSGKRAARLVSGVSISVVTLKVNGVSYPATSWQQNGTVMNITFNINVQPGSTVSLTIPADTFEISQGQSQADGFFANITNVTNTDISVTNNRSWGNATYTVTTIQDLGTKIRLQFSQQISLVSTPPALTFTGNIGGARTATFSNVTNTYMEYTVGGAPIYRGEFLSGFNQVPAGAVKITSAPAGQGLNLAFTPSNFTVGSGDTGAAVPPTATVVSSQILANGTQLQVNWSLAVTYAAGQATLRPTFSPVGNQSLGAPTSTGGGLVWTFNLNANAIRINDIIRLDIPLGWATTNGSGLQVAAANNLVVVNSSTIPYDKPQFLPAASQINADGQSVKLVFDRRVAVGSSFNTAITVLARDKSSSIVRSFTPVVGSAVLSTTSVTEDTVTCSLAGAGTIFGNNIGGPGAPNDGDEVRIHTNNTSGIVVSRLSQDAGAPSSLDPIGTVTSVTDFTNSIPLSNTSLVVEPAAPTVPTYVLSEIFDSGENQFLKIRFNNGSGVSIKIQNNNILPVLVSAFVGPVPLVFHALQAGAGDNDEIVYRMTGNKVVRADDNEVVTLTIPAGVVLSETSGTPNVASGPYTAGTNNFTNNSTIVRPIVPVVVPTPQQAFVGIDGKKIGIYFDSAITALSGSLIVVSLQTGNKTANLSSPASQNTLLRCDIVDTIPIFRGEFVEIKIPADIVQSTPSSFNNIAQTIVAKNNSTISKPLPPVIDSVTLNDPGNLLVITYDVPVIAGTGLGYTFSSESGRNGVSIASISDKTVSVNVAGIDYESETVDLYLDASFVKEAQYGVVGSLPVIKRTVDVSSRTSAAPDLPDIAEGLV